MTTKRDYYDILDIGRDASEEDIHKAFRKKALDYHPDRNKSPGASEQFKEVNEAYQVLTDPERRRRYDRFGHAGVGNGSAAGGRQGFDGYDVFGGFGDIFDAFFGGAAAGARSRQGRDLGATLTITFEEAAFGTVKEVEIIRTERCARCDGNGSEPGHDKQTCSNCRGSGRVRRAQRSVFGQFVTEAACNVCGGAGTVITDPCRQCKGSGHQRAKRKLQVTVPAGVPNGARLSLQGQGDAGVRGGPPGDLYVDVRVTPHEIFVRQENDIVYAMRVSFPEAALGVELEVPTLDGPAKLKIPPGTQPGALFRLKGHGMPHLGRPSRRGDQLVTVDVATPEHLSKRQKQLLEELRQELRT